MQRPKIKKDYTSTFLHKLLRGSKSNITKGTSKAARKTKPYLGAVLPLTHIVYRALGKKDLPNSWVKPDNAKIGSKTEPGSWPAPKSKKPKMPKKPKGIQRKPPTRSEKAQKEKEEVKKSDQLTEEEIEKEML